MQSWLQASALRGLTLTVEEAPRAWLQGREPRREPHPQVTGTCTSLHAYWQYYCSICRVLGNFTRRVAATRQPTATPWVRNYSATYKSIAPFAVCSATSHVAASATTHSNVCQAIVKLLLTGSPASTVDHDVHAWVMMNMPVQS